MRKLNLTFGILVAAFAAIFAVTTAQAAPLAGSLSSAKEATETASKKAGVLKVHGRHCGWRHGHRHRWACGHKRWRSHRRYRSYGHKRYRSHRRYRSYGHTRYRSHRRYRSYGHYRYRSHNRYRSRRWYR